MPGLACTCSTVRMVALSGEPVCPIHNAEHTGSPLDSFLHDEGGMLLVCVCEEDCHHCKYTKLADLIKHGIPFKAFYSDASHHLKPIERKSA